MWELEEKKADLLDYHKHMNGGDVCESRYAIPRVTRSQSKGGLERIFSRLSRAEVRIMKENMDCTKFLQEYVWS